MIPRDDISIGNLTHVGKERTENQDYYGYYEPEDDREFRLKGRLVVVCDGMGGHAGGEIASRMAVNTILREYRNDKTGNVLEALRHAIETSNRAVWEKAQADANLHGMGSTCTAMVLKTGMAYFGHVGDSRAYLLRNGHIQQITKDHSLVQQMVDEGILDPSEMEKHPDKNVILRSMGVKPEVEVDLSYQSIEDGDLFLLCSDGLSGLVNDEELNQIVHQNEENLMQACSELVDLANQRGGYDNITVQVVKVHRAHLPEEEPHESTTQMFDMADVEASIAKAKAELGSAAEGGAAGGASSSESGSATAVQEPPPKADPGSATSGRRKAPASKGSSADDGGGGSGGLLSKLVLLLVGLIVGLLVGVIMASEGVDDAWAQMQEAKMEAVAKGAHESDEFKEGEAAEEEARENSSWLYRDLLGTYEELVDKARGHYEKAAEDYQAPDGGGGSSSSGVDRQAVLEETGEALRAAYQQERQALKERSRSSLDYSKADGAMEDAIEALESGNQEAAVASFREAQRHLERAEAKELEQQVIDAINQADWKDVATEQYEEAWELYNEAKSELESGSADLRSVIRKLGQSLGILNACQELYEAGVGYRREMQQDRQNAEAEPAHVRFAVYQAAKRNQSDGEEAWNKGRLFAASKHFQNASQQYRMVKGISDEYKAVDSKRSEVEDQRDRIARQANDLASHTDAAKYKEGKSLLDQGRDDYDAAAKLLNSSQVDSLKIKRARSRLESASSLFEDAWIAFNQVQTQPDEDPLKTKVIQAQAEVNVVKSRAEKLEAHLLKPTREEFQVGKRFHDKAITFIQTEDWRKAGDLLASAQTSYKMAHEKAQAIRGTQIFRQISEYRDQLDELAQRVNLDPNDADLLDAKKKEEEAQAALFEAESDNDFKFARYKYRQAVEKYQKLLN